MEILEALQKKHSAWKVGHLHHDLWLVLENSVSVSVKFGKTIVILSQ